LNREKNQTGNASCGLEAGLSLLHALLPEFLKGSSRDCFRAATRLNHDDCASWGTLLERSLGESWGAESIAEQRLGVAEILRHRERGDDIRDDASDSLLDDMEVASVDGRCGSSTTSFTVSTILSNQDGPLSSESF